MRVVAFGVRSLGPITVKGLGLVLTGVGTSEIRKLLGFYF